MKNVDTRASNVGTWRRIGGGQGALSEAYEKTGVACIPGKQPDYSGSVRESNVVRLMSKFWNREVEMDLPETAKAAESQAQPGLPEERSAMGTTRGTWEPGVGGRQPGGTDSPDKDGASR
jgi:hypothetical protein